MSIALIALAALLLIPISGIQAQNDTNQTELPRNVTTLPPVEPVNQTGNVTAPPPTTNGNVTTPPPVVCVTAPCPGDNQTGNVTAPPTDNQTTNQTGNVTTEPEPLPDPGSPAMQECTAAYPGNPEICEGAFGAEPDCLKLNAEGQVYNIQVNPPDPFRLDNDGDGLGCEISQLQGQAPSTPAYNETG